MVSSNYWDSQKVRDFDYAQELEFIITKPERNDFLVNLMGQLNGNTLCLFLFVEKHGQVLYDLFKDKIDLTRKNPDVNYTKMAHPDLSAEEINTVNNKNFNMRKMVNREVWELVDYEFARVRDDWI